MTRQAASGLALVADAVTHGDTVRDCIEMARFLSCQYALNASNSRQSPEAAACVPAPLQAAAGA